MWLLSEEATVVAVLRPEGECGVAAGQALQTWELSECLGMGKVVQIC